MRSRARNWAGSYLHCPQDACATDMLCRSGGLDRRRWTTARTTRETGSNVAAHKEQDQTHRRQLAPLGCGLTTVGAASSASGARLALVLHGRRLQRCRQLLEGLPDDCSQGSMGLQNQCPAEHNIARGVVKGGSPVTSRCWQSLESAAQQKRTAAPQTCSRPGQACCLPPVPSRRDGYTPAAKGGEVGSSGAKDRTAGGKGDDYPCTRPATRTSVQRRPKACRT